MENNVAESIELLLEQVNVAAAGLENDIQRLKGPRHISI